MVLLYIAVLVVIGTKFFFKLKKRRGQLYKNSSTYSWFYTENYSFCSSFHLFLSLQNSPPCCFICNISFTVPHAVCLISCSLFLPLLVVVSGQPSGQVWVGAWTGGGRVRGGVMGGGTGVREEKWVWKKWLVLRGWWGVWGERVGEIEREGWGEGGDGRERVGE